ncbi:hypothetical protein [Methylobacterium sp. CCH5-D2]|uniref:hypothetical protein n=1 Tax=Methylobacterium sp. CCH5-D2 TaxID=1768765 RepID=UPI00082E550E|nr:hypothetical protein [Methylobacterium sp. CCH5-D2]
MDAAIAIGVAAVLGLACLIAYLCGVFGPGASAGLTAVVTDDEGEIPPGVYALPPGTHLTGYEPPSFYLPFRVGAAERVVLRYAAE